jgi:hypothetical protein
MPNGKSILIEEEIVEKKTAKKNDNKREFLKNKPVEKQVGIKEKVNVIPATTSIQDQTLIAKNKNSQAPIAALTKKVPRPLSKSHQRIIRKRGKR